MTELYSTVPSTTLNCSLPDITEFLRYRPEHDVKLLLTRVTGSSCRAAHLSTWLRPRITATTSISYACRVFHHGWLRRTYYRVVELYRGNRGFGGSSSEHLSVDSAAEQDLARDQQELCEEVPRNVCRNCREEGRRQEVLQTVWQLLNTWHPWGLHQPSQYWCTVEVQHLKVWGWTVQFEGAHRPHEGGPVRHSLHHWREYRRCVLFPFPFLENLRKKGLEVHYMVDPVVEYTVQQVKEFDEKKLKSTTKEVSDLGDDDEKYTWGAEIRVRASDEADEGDTRPQRWEGNCELQNRRFAVCYHDVRVRLVCQHGAHHVSTGAERQLDDLLHGVQENDWRSTSTAWRRTSTTLITSLARASPLCPLLLFFLGKFAQERSWGALHSGSCGWICSATGQGIQQKEAEIYNKGGVESWWRGWVENIRSWNPSSSQWRSWRRRYSATKVRR